MDNPTDTETDKRIGHSVGSAIRIRNGLAEEMYYPMNLAFTISELTDEEMAVLEKVIATAHSKRTA